MLNVNLFGGPCSSKSTTAAGLFYELKKQNFCAEYVPEFAKELVYSKDFTKLSDQLYVLAEQHHRIFRLKKNVDYLLHDSPILLSLIYLQPDNHMNIKLFTEFVIDLFKSYEGINFYIERNDDSFQEFGRIHNLTESKEKDEEILNLLNNNGIIFYKVNMETAVEEIMAILKISHLI